MLVTMLANIQRVSKGRQRPGQAVEAAVQCACVTMSMAPQLCVPRQAKKAEALEDRQRQWQAIESAAQRGSASAVAAGGGSGNGGGACRW